MASGYHQPPAALTRMALAPKAPDVIVTPRRDFALLCEIPSLPSMAEIGLHCAVHADATQGNTEAGRTLDSR